jgi:hypothetical protein
VVTVADEQEHEPDGEVRDELPHDLDAADAAYVGAYQFPDNARRRMPGVLYLVAAVACVAIRLFAGDDAVLVNDGFYVVAVGFVLIGVYCFLAGWPTKVDDTDALVEATKTVGFPVGHASAQLGWRGLRSRPTWRILLYSAEDPPATRGLVLVDAVDGHVVDHFVEENPEDWEQLES